MKRKFYAVANGKQNGIYGTWSECEEQVKGFKKAKYKSFKKLSDAVDYLSINNEEFYEKLIKAMEVM